jgi:hypothetical protein
MEKELKEEVKTAKIEINEQEATILFSGIDALVKNLGVNVDYRVLQLRDKINQSFD